MAGAAAVRAALLGTLACGLAAAGCGPGAAGVMPSASVVSTVPSWENWFAVDSRAVLGVAGTASIEGYVYNKYGRGATDVRLLAQALDASGQVIDQRLQWLPGGIPQLGRAYFAITDLPAAPAYRVSVWSWDFVQTPGSRFP